MTSAERATEYARSVTAGEMVAGHWVKQACARYLHDLEKSEAWAEYPYRFDHGRANRACRFIEGLPHVKGIWAARRQKLILSPWQLFIVCSLFGWIEKKTGNTRFWEAYVEVARKNGKSPLAAAIGLYKFCAEGEFGAEVYSGATTEKQAWEVFRPARMSCKATPELCAAFGIEAGAKTLYIPANGSRFEPLIGKPGDGAAPSCAIVDEYHEHDTRILYDAMKTGMVGRVNPLLLVITTAGSNLAGPCYALHIDAKKVLDGLIENDRLFCIIFAADLTDDWKGETALVKANPNLGVSVDPRKLQSGQQEAIQSAAKQNVFKTKHENIWCNAAVAWMNLAAWEACSLPGMKLADFAGDECVIALDLASRVDITSKVRLFRRQVEVTPATETAPAVLEQHFFCFCQHYLCSEAIETHRNAAYSGWCHDKWLVSTPGNVTDYGVVASDMVDDARLLTGLREVPHDPWHAAALVQFIDADPDWPKGIPFVEVRQTVQNLSPAMKELEADVLEGRFHHNADPVLTWMMSNVIAYRDAKDNIFPRKENVDAKIDGAVALITARTRYMVEPEGYTSPYVSAV